MGIERYIYDSFLSMGLIGIILLVILFVFLPIIAIVILGIFIANLLSLHGLVWWAFLLIFYLFISGLINALYRS